LNLKKNKLIIIRKKHNSEVDKYLFFFNLIFIASFTVKLKLNSILFNELNEATQNYLDNDLKKRKLIYFYDQLMTFNMIVLNN